MIALIVVLFGLVAFNGGAKVFFHLRDRNRFEVTST